MSEIAAASSEQASGIEEVSKAVVQMDEMTQQNAALVEEAAAAAESLQQQAGNLSERVSTFNIGGKADIAQAVPKKVPQEDRDKKLASTAMLKTNKKLAPKVPHNDEWESF